jgi:hypothetical protein
LCPSLVAGSIGITNACWRELIKAVRVPNEVVVTPLEGKGENCSSLFHAAHLGAKNTVVTASNEVNVYVIETT